MKDKQNEKLDNRISEILKAEFSEKPDIKVFEGISEHFEKTKGRKSAKVTTFMNSFYKIAAGFALFLVVTFYTMGYLKDESKQMSIRQSLPELYSRASWNIGTSIVQDSLKFVQASVLEIR